MGQWFRNVFLAIKTVAEGLYVTLWYFFQTYKRRAFTQQFEYPELPVPVKPRYRGFHRFDLTTCIGCDKCARACPVDCIYIEKEKAKPPLKGFVVTGTGKKDGAEVEGGTLRLRLGDGGGCGQQTAAG